MSESKADTNTVKKSNILLSGYRWDIGFIHYSASKESNVFINIEEHDDILYMSVSEAKLLRASLDAVISQIEDEV